MLDIYEAAGVRADPGRGATLDSTKTVAISCGRQRGRVLVEEAGGHAMSCRSGRGAARTARQAGIAEGQRSSKRQPGSARLGARARRGRRAVGRPRPLGAGQGDGADEEPRVRVPGILDDQLHVAGLHHRATVQHDDVLRDLVRGRQVVRDVDHRDLEVERHLTERPEDRGPERGVDHRHGLVGQDHARPEEERPRHHDALALASRELVRESPERLVGAEPHRAERVLDQRSGPGAGRGQPELGDRHRQDVVHPVERVVDLVRVLEDRLDLAPERSASPPGTWRRDPARDRRRGPPSASGGPAGGAPASSCRCRSRRRRR